MQTLPRKFTQLLVTGLALLVISATLGCDSTKNSSANKTATTPKPVEHSVYGEAIQRSKDASGALKHRDAEVDDQAQSLKDNE